MISSPVRAAGTFISSPVRSVTAIANGAAGVVRGLLGSAGKVVAAVFGVGGTEQQPDQPDHVPGRPRSPPHLPGSDQRRRRVLEFPLPDDAVMAGGFGEGGIAPQPRDSGVSSSQDGAMWESSSSSSSSSSSQDGAMWESSSSSRASGPPPRPMHKRMSGSGHKSPVHKAQATGPTPGLPDWKSMVLPPIVRNGKELFHDGQELLFHVLLDQALGPSDPAGNRLALLPFLHTIRGDEAASLAPLWDPLSRVFNAATGRPSTAEQCRALYAWLRLKRDKKQQTSSRIRWRWSLQADLRQQAAAEYGPFLTAALQEVASGHVLGADKADALRTLGQLLASWHSEEAVDLLNEIKVGVHQS